MVLLLSLQGCSFNEKSQDNKDQHTYFIQTPIDAEFVSIIQNSMKPAIEKVLDEELNLKKDPNIPFFFFKKRAAITIYYLNDMFVSAESILISAISDFKDLQAPKHVAFSSKVDFFGEPKEDRMALIDLVVKIEDPLKELSFLNQQVKKLVYTANAEYKKIYGVEMYDLAKSERHAYLPHLSIGHLRANYIKYLINDNAKAEKIIEKIKNKILKIATDTFAKLTKNDKEIAFTKLSIFDLNKRIYIKDFVYGSE